MYMLDDIGKELELLATGLGTEPHRASYSKHGSTKLGNVMQLDQKIKMFCKCLTGLMRRELCIVLSFLFRSPRK